MDISLQLETDDGPVGGNPVDLPSSPPPNEGGKKRGRPKKEANDNEPIQWTAGLIRWLLEQREKLKNEFMDSKDIVALSRGWSKIVLALQTTFGVKINVIQVKSKYQALQKHIERIIWLTNKPATLQFQKNQLTGKTSSIILVEEEDSAKIAFFLPNRSLSQR